MNMSELFPEAERLIDSLPQPACINSVMIRFPQRRIDLKYAHPGEHQIEINIFPDWCSWCANFSTGEQFEGSFRISPIDENRKFMLVECLQRLVEIEGAGK